MEKEGLMMGLQLVKRTEEARQKRDLALLRVCCWKSSCDFFVFTRAAREGRRNDIGFLWFFGFFWVWKGNDSLKACK